MIHLFIFYIAFALNDAENFRHLPTALIYPHIYIAGEDARDLVIESAAGDMGNTFYCIEY